MSQMLKKLFFMFIMLLIHEVVLCAEVDNDATQYYEEGKQIIEESHLGGEGNKEGYDKAISKFLKAIALNSSFIDAHLALAQAYLNKSTLYLPSEKERVALRRKALELYVAAIEINPNRPDAYYLLGLHVKDENQRINYLRKATEIDPKHSHAFGVLANILLSRDEVRDGYEKYLRHMENNPYQGRQEGVEHVLFAQSLGKAGYRKEALYIYENVLNLARNDGRFEQCILFQSVKLGPYLEFREFVVKVQELKPYCTNLEHRNKAVQLLTQGKTEEAIAELELQINKNPFYEGAYFMLEDIYKRNGRIDKALEVVKRYYTIEKDQSARCARLRYMSSDIYIHSDKEFIEKLKRECGANKVNLRATDIRLN